MKKRLFGAVCVIVICAIALGLWVRLAPSDPAYWHVMPNKARDIDEAGGAIRQVTGAEDAFQRLDQIIRATPRTTLLAGSVEEGMVTYITRSAGFGFPDYTTVRQNDTRLTLYGRLRFGYADLGVNARRLDGWLAVLAQGG